MLSKPANGKQKIIIPTTSCTALSWNRGLGVDNRRWRGGLLLLWTKGPWPLTNGWFALLSGVSACPATGWFLKKYAGVTVSGYVRLAAAALFFVAGRIALAVGS
jgi:hypothetical protein